MRTLTKLSTLLALTGAAACFSPTGSLITPSDTDTDTALDTDPGVSAGPGTSVSPTDPGPTTDTTADPGCETACDTTLPADPSTGCDGPCTTSTGEPDETTSSPGSTTCDGGCQPICGDGKLDPGEACDDGNAEPLDGCDDECRLPRRVFVTAGTFDGSLGDLTDADALCQLGAGDSGLDGVFKAWLSDGVDSPWTRFDITYTGVYARTDGKPIAVGGWPDLTDGALTNPIATDEFGAEVLVSPYVWTATSVEGGTLGNHCLGWSSGLAGSYGIVGSISAKDESWTNADLQPCDVKLRLYCVEDP